MSTPLSVLDVRCLLTAEELAAAHANVNAAPPLTTAQLDILGDIFRPTVHHVTAPRPTTV